MTSELLSISGLINAITSLTFGFLVIAKNWRSRSNQIFFLMTLNVAAWGFGYWQWHKAENYDTALSLVRFLDYVSMLIPVLFFHWVLLYTRNNKGFNIVLLVLLYLFDFVSLFFVNTPLFISHLEKILTLPFWPILGPIYSFHFFAVYSGMGLYSFYILLKTYRKETDQIEQGKLRFVLLGAATGFGGGLTNYPISYGIPLLPYGNFLVAAFPFFLGYSIIRHHLFDVKSTATEILVFFISIVLLIQVFLSKAPIEFAFRLLFFLAVSFLGYLLIRSSRKLFELNEHLEEKVEEQAGEIKRAYEVEKTARIGLEKLNQEKDRFLLATQHNLRTPLTIIKGYVDVALAKEKDPETRRDLEQAADAGGKMTELLNNVLEVAETRVGDKGN